jgi:hypothetical protein
MRTVRYALKTVPVFCDGRWQRASVRPAIAQWAFVKGGAALWRLGCRTLSVLLGGVPDFTPVFGKRWAYMLAPFIFQCADHAEELLIDATAIPPGLTWLPPCAVMFCCLVLPDGVLGFEPARWILVTRPTHPCKQDIWTHSGLWWLAVIFGKRAAQPFVSQELDMKKPNMTPNNAL